MSDVRTLRLASVALTPDLLTRFLRYQRVLAGELKKTALGEWGGKFAFAHAKALAESTLDPLTQQKLRVLVSDFCGRRSAALTVRQRIAEAEHELIQTGPNQKTQTLLDRARRELPKLENLTEFESRYGAAAMALLRADELELVTLHRDLAHLEGGPGHIHGGSTGAA